MCVVVLAGLGLTGCAENRERTEARTETRSEVAEPVRPDYPVPVNQSGRLPREGQGAVEVTGGPVFGLAMLPPGNVAQYKVGKDAYEVGLIDAGNGVQAGTLLTTWKDALQNREFIPHMGGYFGEQGGKPVFVFAKDKWVVGVRGLPKDKADVEARKVAARL